MATNKTKATQADVQQYLASRASAEQSADCLALMKLMKKLTRQEAMMWGPSIVGFGSYQYTYDSGHQGESCLTGFAVRGKDLVIYLAAEGAEQARLLPMLGKHKIGKACLYFKRLADLDLAILEQVLLGSITEIKGRRTE